MVKFVVKEHRTERSTNVDQEIGIAGEVCSIILTNQQFQSLISKEHQSSVCILTVRICISIIDWHISGI